MESPVNLWIRADLETFNSDTLALIPQGQQQEYITVMKELAHARAISALALEQMFLKEQERAAFFEPFISNEPQELIPEVRAPAQPDYTPVTDLNEYRGRRG